MTSSYRWLLSPLNGTLHTVVCRLPAALQVGPGFNRDYWARFEKFIKDTAKASDGVYIVTGPLWLPQPDARGTGKWEMKHPMIGTCQKFDFEGGVLGSGAGLAFGFGN